MLPDRVSNPGPLTYESGALPIALRGPAQCHRNTVQWHFRSTNLGPVVQSIVSLTSSLRGQLVNCFMTL